MIRKPIVTVVGHVDHGKTSVLDAIRSSTVTEREAGKITQAIGASIIPTETLQRVCGKLMNDKLRVPGLLFIDTPGHAAFSTLRKRGGSLADIAILVVDINEGFMPQTEEAIEILKAAKTPFIIAVNKIDLIGGWRKQEGLVLQGIQKQSPQVQKLFEEKMYELVGHLYEKFQLQAERFDRVQDYGKQIALVPMSAHTKEGLPELLMVLVGLIQKYLKTGLDIDEKGEAKGTVLEVKEQQGVGTVLDVILYNGRLQPGDPLIVGGMHEPIITKIRGLFEPNPHAEMMDSKGKYASVKEAVAATGVRIVAPNVEGVVAGMPLMTARATDEKDVIEEVQSQIQEVVIATEKEGIVIKADTLGSLEAMITLLQEKDVPIRKATIGSVTKKDMADAASNYEKDPLMSVVLAFNVKGEASSDHVKVIRSDIIYKVIEDFELWQESMKKQAEEEDLASLVRPCKIEVMKGYVFRQSNPAVVGVSVEEGMLKTGMPLMNKEGKDLATVKELQAEQKTASKAEKGKQVACSLPGLTVGRQINEGDVLYSSVPEMDFIKLKALKHLLSREEIETLKAIAAIKREKNPVWGI